jgi:undecaprenyl diphosphate synthase
MLQMSTSYLEKIDRKRVPNHVAIIMDGNGRWAKSMGKDRSYGHVEGVVSVRHVVEAAKEAGVSYLTLYTFSTENWNRPSSEVIGLMELMMKSIERETPDLIKNGIRLQVIGEMERLPESLRQRTTRCVNDTASGMDLTLILALSYSSRWEILNAVKMITTDLQAGKLTMEKLDEQLFGQYLTTKDIPDPDLMVRPGGEYRISNFLLWQAAYSELYFTETPWPIFRKEEFWKAIYDYQNRERRFGKTSEQVKQ